MKLGVDPLTLTIKPPHHRVRDITGFRRGALTVLRYAGSTGTKGIWAVQCDCGNVAYWDTRDIERNQSCGCKRSALISKASTKHGMSTHPAYWVWRSMVDRCTLPTHQSWHNYGARGITVCPQWVERFDNFWTDMGPTYATGLDLDRTDNNAGYSPGNCRWVTRATNANNRRTTVLIDTPAGRMSIAQAAQVAGIGVSTMHYRVQHEWPAETLFRDPHSGVQPTTSPMQAPTTGLQFEVPTNSRS